jgi:ubiquinone/menaquinone biosynthesis C-methylase UbiE
MIIVRKNSINAYNLPARVASYDADMEIMHPNRSKMVDIALEILPFDSGASITALELGTGTGFFTRRFLEHFPNSKVISIDGAQSMVDLARVRIGPLVDRVDFRIGDFRQLRQIIPDNKRADVVFSSYSFHHLSVEEKTDVIRQALGFLHPGGWFVNVDIIVSESEYMENLIQEIRVNGIVRRASGSDQRFRDCEATRSFLSNLEGNEADQPVTLMDDLQILKDADLKDVSVFWLEYREVVYGGRLV